jgi:hypothetical protein
LVVGGSVVGAAVVGAAVVGAAVVGSLVGAAVDGAAVVGGLAGVAPCAPCPGSFPPALEQAPSRSAAASPTETTPARLRHDAGPCLVRVTGVPPLSGVLPSLQEYQSNRSRAVSGL